MKKKIMPIGIDDFRKLINNNYYYVDKSLFIKEIIDDGAEVKLITRPRRFGKSLNLSMLKYFFEKTEQDNSHLFKDLQIWQEGDEYTSHQGQYPVVYLSFKDIKFDTFDECFRIIKKVIAEEFDRHKYILECDRIDEFKKQQFIDIKNENVDNVDLCVSLKLLTKLLSEYYQKEFIVLIDEYDTPINQGYICGYYEKIINFTRAFLGGGLKGNPELKMAVITGIYRVAKESMFSGFNNIEVSSIMQRAFADKFGFTEKEIEEMMLYYDMDIKINEVKQWYNGYVFGDNIVIYNPWSIASYIKQGVLGAYWVNTSNNDIIRDIFLKTEGNVKKKLQLLMGNSEIKDVIIKTDTNFRDILNKETIEDDVLWSMLLVSGYLKRCNLRYSDDGDAVCDLKVPNKEILKLYKDIVADWFSEANVTGTKIKSMLYSLVEGDVEEFKKDFEYIVEKTFSYFDVGTRSAENFYHAFVLGLLVNLDGKYRIKSNIESGHGRPDVMIIPNDKSKKGVVIEFKVADSGEDEVLKVKAQEALMQIRDMDYANELVNCGISEAVEVAVVFYRKQVYIEHTIYKISQ